MKHMLTCISEKENSFKICWFNVEIHAEYCLTSVHNNDIDVSFSCIVRR